MIKLFPFSPRKTHKSQHAPTNTGTGRWHMVAMAMLGLFLNACTESDKPAVASPNVIAERDYPQPPPPMTSATHILSGGWVITGDGNEPLFDHIVVVQDGAVLSMGKRGSLEVPADSIGIDASGKWILPGPADMLAQQFQQRQHESPALFTNTQFTPISPGRGADLVLLNRNPLIDPQALTDVHALLIGGELQLVENDSSGEG